MHARIVAAALAFAALSAAACGPGERAEGADVDTASLYVTAGYDVAADPFADLELAKAQAQASGKRILLEVGGDWCVWCHILDRYIADHDDVRAALADSFVILKVNWSEENRNADFLSHYPEIPGYPHFFILAADGSFLRSQGTAELEDGGESYDRRALITFARAWRPGA